MTFAVTHQIGIMDATKEEEVTNPKKSGEDEAQHLVSGGDPELGDENDFFLVDWFTRACRRFTRADS